MDDSVNITNHTGKDLTIEVRLFTTPSLPKLPRHLIIQGIIIVVLGWAIAFQLGYNVGQRAASAPVVEAKP